MMGLSRVSVLHELDPKEQTGAADIADRLVTRLEFFESRKHGG